MDVRGRANYGEMGSVGYVLLGLKADRPFKFYLFEYGLGRRLE